MYAHWSAATNEPTTYKNPTRPPAPPHPKAYWVGHGVADGNDVDRLARRSAGLPYSFWGVARVAHSTIKGQFDKVSEKSYHWMRLVSFSLDPEDHEGAREELSGGPELPLAEEEEAAEEASEPAAQPPHRRLS